jgi:hypothetical protein
MAISVEEANKRLIEPPKKGVSINEANKQVIQETAPEKPFQFSGMETIRNIGPSALNTAKNYAGAFFPPSRAIQGVLDVGSGLMINNIPGYESFLRNYTGETPQEIERVKQIGTGASKYYSERAKNPLKTLQQDPVGMLGDVSALLTGGGTVLPKIGGAVTRTGAAIDPLNLTANTLMYGATKAIPKSVAPALYESAVKWSTKLSPSERNVLTQTALDEQIMPTYSGLAKIALIKNQLKDNIDNIIDTATNSNVKIPSSTVFNYINEAKQNLGGFKIGAADDLAEINRIERNFKAYLSKNKMNEVTPRQLQEFKSDAYKRIDFDRAAGNPTVAKEEVFKGMSKAAREALEQQDPALKALNARFGSLINLEEPLQRAAGRIENRNMFGLDLGTKTTAGGVVAGGPGAAVGALLSFLDLPIPKSKAALELYKKQKQGINMFRDNSPTSALIRNLIEERGTYNQYPGILNYGQEQ